MKILIGTDGSPAAALGIELVSRLHWEPGSAIRVVSAVDTAATLFGGPWPTVALAQASEIESQLKAAADASLRAALGPLTAAGLAVDTAVIDGRPSMAIVEEAERFGADVIVVGSRGHGGLERILLGSVTAEILDQARRPVLVARGDSIDRVLLAWDGSPSADRAAAILAAWPIFRASVVRVVSVAETATPWWAGTPEAATPVLIDAIQRAVDEGRAEQAKETDAAVGRLRNAGLVAESEIREGAPAAELLAAAEAWGADLVVAGTHGRTGLARLALGSVARHLVSHATCSILVVRGPESDGHRERGS